MNRIRPIAALTLLLVLPLAWGCRPADPRTEALRQRARFTVELLSWVPRDDGTNSFTVRVTGPPSSSLESLTFLVTQVGADGTELAAEWKTIDLAEVPRGAPKEMFFSVPSAGEQVDGLAVSLVLHPTAEQESQIRELSDL